MATLCSYIFYYKFRVCVSYIWINPFSNPANNIYFFNIRQVIVLFILRDYNNLLFWVILSILLWNVPKY